MTFVPKAFLIEVLKVLYNKEMDTAMKTTLLVDIQQVFQCNEFVSKLEQDKDQTMIADKLMSDTDIEESILMPFEALKNASLEEVVQRLTKQKR